jgi:hypothetical protein
MNCAGFEQLIDAYLDGELSGTLRLEFDTHRLRCRRCQLTLAMMESVEHVVAADRGAPALADDFADRVMIGIRRRQTATLRIHPARVAVVAAALLQAAAVLYLAVGLPSRTPGPSLPARGAASTFDKEVVEDLKIEKTEMVYAEVMRRMESARSNLASDLSQLARYPLALSVSDEFARASAQVSERGPWGVFFRSPQADEPSDGDPVPGAADGQHSL